MRPDQSERGFALVAAMFVMIVIAVAIAAMARLSVTQVGTVSLALQQARAYQAARAGLEWGVYRITRPFACGDAPPIANAASFVIDGFTVVVPALTPDVAAGRVFEEEGTVRHYFYQVSAVAQSGAITSPDYAYRKLEVIAEVMCTQP
jgi:MSHA biogenesis protein MshP